MNNNTTTTPNTQAQMGGLSPDQIMSSLAFTTHLHEQSLPKDVPQEQAQPTAPQMPKNAPKQAETPEPDEKGEGQKIDELNGKIDQLTKMVMMLAKDEKTELAEDKKENKM